MPVRPALTPALRQKLGLPAVADRPYPWPLAVMMVALASGALWLAGYPKLMAVVAAAGLVVLPGVRWLEGHDRSERERLYRQGREARATIIEVEPAGDRRNDHRVRLELFVDGKPVTATVVGSPLARQGLGPGDEVRVIHDERDPRRCLLLGRAPRRPIIDAVFLDDEPPAANDTRGPDPRLN